MKNLPCRPGALIAFAVLACGCVGQIEHTDEEPGVAPVVHPGPGGTAGQPLPPGGGSHSAGATAPSGVGCTVPRRAVRLSDEQYAQAVADLLPGLAVTGIKTPGGGEHDLAITAEGPIDGRLVFQLHQAAVAAAEQVARDVRLAVACRPGEDERACARGFIDRFVARAYRRRLLAAERERLMALYELGRADGFGAGVALVVRATLQSADFVYRTELGDPSVPAGRSTTLSPHERAAALSFFLLNSAPDDELWRAAESGALANPREVEAQVARLLALPRVQDNLVTVMSQWFGVPRVLSAETMTTGFDQALRRSMHDEARRFLRFVLWKGGTIGDLLTSRQAFPDTRLAPLYGVSAPSAAGEGRPLAADRWTGILSRPGFVAGLPTGNRSVFRGLFIRSHVLCGHLAPPPGDLDSAALAKLDSARSERDRVAVRAETAACAGCHALMDPLGMALEHYDDIGRYVTTREGRAVDASGKLVGTDVDGPFASAIDLSEMFARSSTVASCAVAHLAAAATARSPDDMLSCDRPVLARLAPGDVSLSGIVRAIATGPLLSERGASGGQP